MARRPVAALLVLLATVLVAVGLPLQHLHGVTRPGAFADHASAVEREPAVRAALSDAAVDAVVDAVEEISRAAGPAARSVVAPRAARVVASAGFARAWRSTARRGLRSVLDEDRRRVAFTVTDVAGLTATATGPLPPALEALLRSAGPVPIFTFDRSRTTAVRTARAETLAGLGRPLLGLALLALVAAIVVSPARPSTARLCGLGVLGAAAFVAAAELLARTLVLGGASGRDRDVAGIVWDELLGGLRTDALLLAGAGLVVALAASLLGRPRPAGRPAYPLG